MLGWIDAYWMYLMYLISEIDAAASEWPSEMHDHYQASKVTENHHPVLRFATWSAPHLTLNVFVAYD